jgi:hypothetical protein
MAKKNSNQTQMNDAATNTFSKGLIKDYDDTYFPEGSWSHARNAVNNSTDGNLGVLGNEPSNILCAPPGADTTAPYQINGAIYLTEDKWVITSGDGNNSEVGLFVADQCQYYKIVNDSCLNFQSTHIIIGVSKQNADCTWQVYFADGLNPDRSLNIGDISMGPFPDPWPGVPYFSSDIIPGECEQCEPIGPPYQLDCERLRIAKLIKTPSITLNRSLTGGTLLNGSYFASIAYAMNGERVTDYFAPSNVQSIFAHDNVAGGLQLVINDIETDIYSEFELVITKVINQQTVAKRIGIYNTSIGQVEIPEIPDALETIPISNIIINNAITEKSNAMFAVNDYLVRIGPSSRFDFNYQPLANLITAKWVVTEYSSDYYFKGGNVTGYMRDEVYSFFIRWIYNTGDKSSSYHIPGRPAIAALDLPTPNSALDNFDNNAQRWEVYNTAYTVNPGLNISQPDGGVIVAKGRMGYWESTEIYPNNKPDVWNADTWGPVDTFPTYTSNVNDYNLCGKHIRHHKMPADVIMFSPNGSTTYDDSYSHVRSNADNRPTNIRILGVEFDNILPPVYEDENGNRVVIPGVVGYEILRGSRQGNKTVIAKGIVNNARYYVSPDGEDQILYQNYPYNPLYDSNNRYLQAYPDLSESDVPGGPSNSENAAGAFPSGTYKKNIFTFHSFDTQLISSYLAVQELVVYGERGYDDNVSGNFSEVPGHPKHKLLTDAAFILALILGLAEAFYKIRGTKTRSQQGPRELHLGVLGGGAPLSGGGGQPLTLLNGSTVTPWDFTIKGPASPLQFGTIAQGNKIAGTAWTVATGAIDGVEAGAGWAGYLVGTSPDFGAWKTSIINSTSLNPSKIGYQEDYSLQLSGFNMLPPTMQAAGGIIASVGYWAQGATTTVNLFLSATKYRQYAYRYLSHGDLTKFSRGNSAIANYRRKITRSFYLENLLQNFPASDSTQTNYTVNNLFRGRCVLLETDRNVNNPSGLDNSLNTIKSANAAGYIEFPGPTAPEKRTRLVEEPFNTNAYSYYVGLKIKRPNLYGQLNSIIQVNTNQRTLVKPLPDGIDTCNNSNLATLNNTDLGRSVVPTIVYGGDTYIGRYTEKNTFFYFRDWLYGQPDGTQFDYSTKYMISFPRYWANFSDFDGSSFLGSVFSSLTQAVVGAAMLTWNGPLTENWDIPSNLHHLDRNLNFGNSLLSVFALSVKNGFMYLYQSGVRDFYMESEYNLDLRDWGNDDAQRFYDPYRFTELETLFDPPIIKSGNYFKYDLSLGITKLYKDLVTWGNLQPISYNPFVAETCYTYYPNRLIYSLPQNAESIRDYWQTFLTFNYKDFRTNVMSIKPYDQSGVVIFFDGDSPVMTRTVENLQLDLGTKLNIGDGSLFSQPLQSLSNADTAYQYGSTQDTLSVINTPLGIYYIGQNQGKIFRVGEGLEELSNAGLKWWFAKYLPYKLLEDFPEFELVNNPIAGIGCQSSFDNENQIVYFSKRDFQLKPDAPYALLYEKKDIFRVIQGGQPSGFTVKLGDPLYFEDASWTVSYDPKAKAFISFHDWHPDLMIPAKTNIYTTKVGGIWKHNESTSSYTNFYGIDYPFEVEEVVSTGQTVNSIKSMEYILEAYVYSADGYDKFHVLDYNFNKAIVYNSEQVSGELRLNLHPKNNPAAAMQYPIITPTYVDILYSKEENKYRFNQFWDLTRDRGEYTGFVTQMWDTQANGYISLLNPNNINYDKSPFQRKKFRHYVNRLRLIRENAPGQNNTKMLYKINNMKQTLSPR